MNKNIKMNKASYITLTVVDEIHRIVSFFIMI